jgi:hypothetical protein
MLSACLRLSLCALAVAGLAGCGGGSNGGNGSAGGGTGGGSSNPTVVTYNFTGTLPTAVATQIGTAAYTQAALDSGKLTVSVPSGTTNYAVAYACPTNPSYVLPLNYEYVVEASTLDGASFSLTCLAMPTTGAATLQVDASAIPGAAYVFLASLAEPWKGNPVSMSAQLPVGTRDIAVYVTDQTQINVLAARILRNQTIPGALNNGNEVVFSASDETVPETATVNGLPSGFSTIGLLANYETANGGYLTLSYEFSPQYFAMPSAEFQTGDYYVLVASANSIAAPNEIVRVESATPAFPPRSTFPPAPTCNGMLEPRQRLPFNSQHRRIT